MTNSVKTCSFFKCHNPADILVTFSGVACLESCSFYLCSKHAATPPFNIKEDIISEKKLHEEKNNV